MRKSMNREVKSRLRAEGNGNETDGFRAVGQLSRSCLEVCRRNDHRLVHYSLDTTTRTRVSKNRGSKQKNRYHEREAKHWVTNMAQKLQTHRRKGANEGRMGFCVHHMGEYIERENDSGMRTS